MPDLDPKTRELLIALCQRQADSFELVQAPAETLLELVQHVEQWLNEMAAGRLPKGDELTRRREFVARVLEQFEQLEQQAAALDQAIATLRAQASEMLLNA